MRTYVMVFHQTKWAEPQGMAPVAVLQIPPDDDVSNVDDMLDIVWEKTNHIDKDWTENDVVLLTFTKHPRSSSVGDIFAVIEDEETPQAIHQRIRYFRVNRVGFEQMGGDYIVANTKESTNWGVLHYLEEAILQWKASYNEIK